MLTMDPIDLYIRLALATVGAQETPVGSNAGMFVERCQKVTGGKVGDAWCCDYASMLGQTAFGARWPLPLTGSVADLTAFAEKGKILVATPQRGDLFVVWHAGLKRFAHVGLVVSVNSDGSIRSISGNTTDPVRHVDGATSREGWCVADKPWHITPEDRFIRWSSIF